MTSFDKLLLATGSMPLIPSIEDVRKDGVFVFRTLDDTRALLERARPGLKAVVIGGGLLGLEAARGLQVQGCDVTVVHLMETLMERQLDPDGRRLPRGKMKQLGITVLLGLQHNRKFSATGMCRACEFKGGGKIDADLVVIAAGIRPNVDARPTRPASKSSAASSSTTTWRRRIPTSSPSANACEHSGICYGLVAPLFEQGKVLAATITGNKGPKYRRNTFRPRS